MTVDSGLNVHDSVAALLARGYLRTLSESDQIQLAESAPSERPCDLVNTREEDAA